MRAKEELAWAAGLFEGEGCITIQRHKIRLQLASSDKDVVDRFASIIGVGSTSGPFVRPTRLSSNPKPMWFWVAVSGNAEAVLHKLLPYLGCRRRERALGVLAVREEHVQTSTQERTCAFCERAFRPPWGNSSARVRFCSAWCRNEAARTRARASRVSDPRLCAVCTKTFVPRRRNQIHCSKPCRDRLGKQRKKERMAA